MPDEVDRMIFELPIPPHEWLLNEDSEQLDLEALRQKCLWEYARESECLTGLAAEVTSLCEERLDHGCGGYEVAEYLYDFTAKWYWGFYRTKAPKLSPEDSRKLCRLIFQIHELASPVDWRFLFTPLYPEPWDHSRDADFSKLHTLEWRPPKKTWGWELVLNRRQRPEGFIKIRQCEFDGVLIIAGQDVFTSGDLANAGLEMRASVPAVLLLFPPQFIFNRRSYEIAEDVEVLFSGGTTPNGIRIGGEIGVDDAIFSPEKGSAQIIENFLGLHDSAVHFTGFFALKASWVLRPDNKHSNGIKAPIPDRKAEIFAVAYNEVERLKEGAAGTNYPAGGVLLYDRKQCITALNELGALRVRKHVDPNIMESLWDAEQKRRPMIKVNRVNDKRQYDSSERAAPSNRPIYSKWEIFDKTWRSALPRFRSIFPKLTDSVPKSAK